MLTSDLIQQATYIFGMPHSHVDAIIALYPSAAEKTFLLREFDDTLDAFGIHGIAGIGGSLLLTFFIRSSWMEETSARAGAAWTAWQQLGV